jgi:hypothetical protein
MSSLQPQGDQARGIRLDRVASPKRTALLFPADLPLDIWTKIGEQIYIVSDANAWWIGDWLNFGRDKYPDRYRQAIEGTSLRYQTLRNYAWVAGRFEVSRRRDTLSFQHHVEVAALPEDQQDLWLQRAECAGWSRTELRLHIRERLSGGQPLPAALRLSISQERKQRWQDAATNAHVGLNEWISVTLDRVASDELRADPRQCGDQEAEARGELLGARPGAPPRPG